MKVLAEEGGIIAIDKPPGLAVIPGRGEGPNLRELLEQELRKKVWVVHRLDRDTSGVLVFALNAEAHRAWSMAFEHHQVKKRYLALVEGAVVRELDLDWPIGAARKGRMKVSPMGKPARTRVRPVEQLKGATLVEAEPLTGRTHQIRVHLAHCGHALLFDHQYRHGEQSTLIGRTPLHATRVEWNGLSVESALPDDMLAAIAALR